ncbi:DUF397 domain-containing protein [Streptomyces luteireticuli]
MEWAPAFASSGVVPVRDSKVPDGHVVTVSPSTWSAFVTTVKSDNL